MNLLNTYRVVLFGHRDFNGHNKIDEELYPLIKSLIQTKPFVEIYIGRNGEFDVYAASVIKRVRNATGTESSELICVLPYHERDIEYYEKYYGTVIIPECVGQVHPKSAIKKRNRWMVELADLVICYVEQESGGAYAALKYAQSLGKKIINLAKTKKSELYLE